MNRFTPWVPLLAAWLLLPGTAAAAPAPSPAPQGAIADALRMLALLPATAPLTVRAAVMGKEGVVELERPALMPVRVRQTVVRMVPVEKQVTENLRLPDGKVVQVERKVVAMIPQEVWVDVMVMQPAGKAEIVPVPVKSCKFFVVTKEGKLDALDSMKAAELLKKKTAVLTGGGAEVDPRHLELIRPGTLYLVLPPPSPPMPPAPDRKPEN